MSVFNLCSSTSNSSRFFTSAAFLASKTFHKSPSHDSLLVTVFKNEADYKVAGIAGISFGSNLGSVGFAGCFPDVMRDASALKLVSCDDPTVR